MSPKNGAGQFGVGCLKGLVWLALTWAVASAGLLVLFEQRYDAEPARSAAMAAGAFVTLFSGFFWRGVSRTRTAWKGLTSSEREGPCGLRTVAGRIVPIGAEKLLSPPSGTECVAYSYDAFARDGDGGRSTSFSGFALNPCEIRYDSGAIRLLGMPFSDDLKELGEVPERIHSPNSAAWTRLKDYLSTAPIERHELSIRDFKNALQGILDVMDDTNGTIRKDLASPNADPDLTGQLIAERIVPVGAEVTVSGLYSAERGGFVNDPERSSGQRLHLFLGNRKATSNTLWKQAAGNFVLGGLLSGIVLGIALLILENGKGPKESVTRNVFDAVAKDDAALATRCIAARALNLNLPGGGGRTPLTLAHSASMTKLLLQGGADVNRKDLDGTTPLLAAVRRGDAESTRLLLAAGAKPNDPDSKEGRSPLAWATETHADEIVTILRQAGAE